MSSECSTPTRESGIVLNRCPKRRLSRGLAHPSNQGKVRSERLLLKQRELRRGEEQTKRGELTSLSEVSADKLCLVQFISGTFSRDAEKDSKDQKNFTGAVRLTWSVVIMWVGCSL